MTTPHHRQRRGNILAPLGEDPLDRVGFEFALLRALDPRIQAAKQGPARHVPGQSQIVRRAEGRNPIGDAHRLRLAQDVRINVGSLTDFAAIPAQARQQEAPWCTRVSA